MPRESKRSRKGSKHSSRTDVTGIAEQHCLDLEPESPVTREIRSQERVRWGFNLAVIVLVLVGLFALGRATVREAFENNPRFTLKEVVVKTEGVLTPQKIVKTAGLTDGQNLLSINLRELRERIERLPQVKSGMIERDYEGKLKIAVEQRRPVAWLESQKLKLRPLTHEGGMMVDKEGVVVPCEILVKSHLSMPLIRMEQLNEIVPGRKIESPQLAAALKLIGEIKRRSAGVREQVSRVEILNEYALQTAFTDGLSVTFGMDGLAEQIARYSRIRREAEARGWQIATLNLLVEDNIPVTFKNTTAAAGHAGEDGGVGRVMTPRRSGRRN